MESVVAHIVYISLCEKKINELKKGFHTISIAYIVTVIGKMVISNYTHTTNVYVLYVHILTMKKNSISYPSFIFLTRALSKCTSSFGSK